MRYDYAMAKRDLIYADMETESDYPPPEDMIHKNCQICGRDMVVNNWPDRKSRTAIFKGFIVCPWCDPRHPEDFYKKTGYRILHPGRLRVIRYAQVTRALAKHGCIRPMEDGADCKCAGCAAVKLLG